MRSRVPSLQRNIGIGGAVTFLGLLVIGYFVYTSLSAGRTIIGFVEDPVTIINAALVLVFTVSALLDSKYCRAVQSVLPIVFGCVALAFGERGSLTGFSVAGVGIILAAHYGYFRRAWVTKSALILTGIGGSLLLQAIRVTQGGTFRWTSVEFLYSAIGVTGLLYAYFVVLRDAAANAQRQQAILEHEVQIRTRDLKEEMGARSAAESAARASARVAENLAEQRMALLQEVHHRAKNSLQMAISLVESMNPASPDDQSMTVNRMRAIGLVYDIVDSASDLNSVELEGYLVRLCTYLQMSRSDAPVMILYDAEGSHRANLDATINLGLMMNEIFRLACDHSFPDQPGAVEISQSETDTVLCFEISHSGERLPKQVDPETRPSPSSAVGLLPAFFERLHATVSLRVEPTNLWQIRVPRQVLAQRSSEDSSD